MSESVNDGGPAFPSQNGVQYDPGMPLRDWFAGQALSAVISPETHMATITAAAQCCYDIADAMIEARKAGKVMSRVPDNVLDELIRMLERLVGNDSGCFGGGYKWQRLIEEAESLIEKAKGGKPS